MKKLLTISILAICVSGCSVRDSYATRYFGSGVAIGGATLATYGVVNENSTQRNSGIGLTAFGLILVGMSYWVGSENYEHIDN
jgi:hypothetical protein